MGQTSKSAKRTAIQPWVWIVSIVVLAVAIYAVSSALAGPASTTSLAKEVNVTQAAELRDQGAFVLDVREPDEWAAGHIPGATLIPLGQLTSRLAELPQNQPIVVVCRSGNRSATGRDLLLDAGFAEVTSMGGGMNAWASQGLVTVTGP
jgi:rhodanese-related sulfurtransferase